MRNSAILAAFLLLTFSNAQAENSYDSNVDTVYIHSQKTTLFTPGFHEPPIGPVAYQRYNSRCLARIITWRPQDRSHCLISTKKGSSRISVGEMEAEIGV